MSCCFSISSFEFLRVERGELGAWCFFWCQRRVLFLVSTHSGADFNLHIWSLRVSEGAAENEHLCRGVPKSFWGHLVFSGGACRSQDSVAKLCCTVQGLLKSTMDTSIEIHSSKATTTFDTILSMQLILTINIRKMYIHIDILSKCIYMYFYIIFFFCKEQTNIRLPLLVLHYTCKVKTPKRSWNSCISCSIPSTEKPPLTETSARRGQSLRLMERWRRRCEKHL